MSGTGQQIKFSKRLIAMTVIIVLMIGTYLFRHNIVTKAFTHFSEQSQAQIACLEFSVDWAFNLNLKQACVTSPQGQITIENAYWQLWSNTLTVERISIEHSQKSTSEVKITSPETVNTTSDVDISIPNMLPMLNIDQLNIQSYLLQQPMQLRLSQVTAKELQVSGDIQATATWQSNQLAGMITWQLSDLVKFLPDAHNIHQEQAQYMNSLDLSKHKVKTNFDLSVSQLTLESQLRLDGQISADDCPIDVDIEGWISTIIDFKRASVNLDLSELKSIFALQSCSRLTDYLAPLNLQNISLSLPQDILLESTHIRMPLLIIASINNSQNNIHIKSLNYTFGSEQLDFDYNAALLQSIHTDTGIKAELDFSAKGQAKLKQYKTAMTSAQAKDNASINWQVRGQQNNLKLSELKNNDFAVKKILSDLSFTLSNTHKPTMNGSLLINEVQSPNASFAKFISKFSLVGENIDNISVVLDNQLSKLNHSNFQTSGIANHIKLTIKQLQHISFSGQSDLTELSSQQIAFPRVDITHSGEFEIQTSTLTSQHGITLATGLHATLQQDKGAFSLAINQQELRSLQGMIQQTEEALSIEQGDVTVNMAFAIPATDEPFMLRGHMDIKNVDLRYQDYGVQGGHFEGHIMLDSAGLQLPSANLLIEQVNVGIGISNINSTVMAKDGQLSINDIQGDIFNGQFSMNTFWLDGRQQDFDISIKNIDLAQLVALQKQPGIEVTGTINGDLPLNLTSDGVTVEGGWVISPTGGKLKIVDNPSFDSIKSQQPELALLEELDFTQLSSKISMQSDGWMLFELALTGNNPKQNQSVNFNYSHQENILSLLESIRLTQSVENSIEQKLKQGGGN